MNGDGYSDVIVGADSYDNTQTNEGRIQVYLGSASGLSSVAVRTLDGGQAGALFGNNVGTAGDVNGDGYSEVIAGAPNYDNGESHEGRAYVFIGSPAGTVPLRSTVEGNQLGASFGNSFATAGDVNGDGYADVKDCSSTLPPTDARTCGVTSAVG